MKNFRMVNVAEMKVKIESLTKKKMAIALHIKKKN